MENDNTLRIVIGAVLGVGCAGFLLVCCAATGVWLVSRAPMTTPDPGYTPPPYTPPPYTPPPYTPPPLPPIVPPTVPVLPPPPFTPDVAPRTIRATVTEVTGAAGIEVGALCEFNVERRENTDTGGFWCNAQIVCGGRLFYGGSGAGFFPCTLYEGPPRDVVGEDHDTTTVDRDGAMRLDTRAGTLEVWDDATGTNGELRITAHVDSVE